MRRMHTLNLPVGGHNVALGGGESMALWDSEGRGEVFTLRNIYGDSTSRT
jgi:hypothetical protein